MGTVLVSSPGRWMGKRSGRALAAVLVLGTGVDFARLLAGWVATVLELVEGASSVVLRFALCFLGCGLGSVVGVRASGLAFVMGLRAFSCWAD